MMYLLSKVLPLALLPLGLSLLLLLWPAGWVGHGLALTVGWWLFWPSLLLALSSAAAYLRPRSASRQS